jgi:hypothetical protein
MPRGIVSLATGAAELFRRTQARLPVGTSRFMGLDVAALGRFVEDLAARPPGPGEQGGQLVLRPERAQP